MSHHTRSDRLQKSENRPFPARWAGKGNTFTTPLFLLFCTLLPAGMEARCATPPKSAGFLSGQVGAGLGADLLLGPCIYLPGQKKIDHIASGHGHSSTYQLTDKRLADKSKYPVIQEARWGKGVVTYLSGQEEKRVKMEGEGGYTADHILYCSPDETLSQLRKWNWQKNYGKKAGHMHHQPGYLRERVEKDLGFIPAKKPLRRLILTTGYDNVIQARAFLEEVIDPKKVRDISALLKDVSSGVAKNLICLPGSILKEDALPMLGHSADCWLVLGPTLQAVAAYNEMVWAHQLEAGQHVQASSAGVAMFLHLTC